MSTLTTPSAAAGFPTRRVRELNKLAATSTIPVSLFVGTPGGSISDLRGKFDIAKGGTLETNVTSFLRKAAPAIGLPTDLGGLTLASTERLLEGGRRVFFVQQTGVGIPVLGAGVAVDVDTTGSVA